MPGGSSRKLNPNEELAQLRKASDQFGSGESRNPADLGGPSRNPAADKTQAARLARIKQLEALQPKAPTQVQLNSRAAQQSLATSEVARQARKRQGPSSTLLSRVRGLGEEQATARSSLFGAKRTTQNLLRGFS